MEYNLERFVEAQKRDYQQALSEIKSGRKMSHWIWYVFPQLDGLGKSYNSHYYGIKNEEEAIRYMQNSYLKNNMIEICNALLSVENKSARDVMGQIDDYKLKSCMTLFANVCEENQIFLDVLDKYYNGRQDRRTLKILERNKENKRV